MAPLGSRGHAVGYTSHIRAGPWHNVGFILKVRALPIDGSGVTLQGTQKVLVSCMTKFHDVKESQACL